MAREKHIVPTYAQLRELYLLRAWVNPPAIESLRDGGAKNGLINSLLRHNINDVDTLYPIYQAIRGRLTNGRMRQVTWELRHEWLPIPLEGVGAAKAERIVEVYEAWADWHPADAAAIADNEHRREVPFRAKLAAIAYLHDGAQIGDIATTFGVTPDRVRVLLKRAGVGRDVRQLHEINQHWVQHWDAEPCTRADAGLGPCQGHHEHIQPTWWGVATGPWEIICHHHADVVTELSENYW